MLVFIFLDFQNYCEIDGSYSSRRVLVCFPSREFQASTNLGLPAQLIAVEHFPFLQALR